MDKRKRLFHANSRRGRVWLVMVWVLLRILDAVVYLQPGASASPRVKAFLVGDIVWTTALLVALGYRQAWAKYAFIGLLILESALDVIQASGTSSGVPTALIVDVLGRIIALLVICRSWDIKRLTSRSYE